MLTALPGGTGRLPGLRQHLHLRPGVLPRFLRDRLHHHPAAGARPPTKLGIDLIWFGVLICANMQTCFMHPPFGFALFYLRGDRAEDVKTSDIYLGAIPWVGLQLLLVALLIAFPGMVTYFACSGGPVRPQQDQDRGAGVRRSQLSKPPQLGPGGKGQPPPARPDSAGFVPAAVVRCAGQAASAGGPGPVAAAEIQLSRVSSDAFAGAGFRACRRAAGSS